MPTWAPNAIVLTVADFGRDRQGAPVTGAWLHHQANGAGADAIDFMSHPNSRDSHPTYASDKTGKIYGIVHPDRCPSSTFYVNDQGAITFELANIAGAPGYEVPDALIEQVAQVLAHHAKESPRANRVERNVPGQTQAGFWLGTHDQVLATACPGPDVRSKIDRIIARANEILAGKGAAPASSGSGGSKPAPSKPKPTTAPKFPLPRDWYFGPESGPVESVSAKHANKYGSVDELRKMLWRWQQRMEDRGWSFPTYGSDGIYGPETRDVVRRFQAEKGLAVDGLIGPETWAAAWTEPVT